MIVRIKRIMDRLSGLDSGGGSEKIALTYANDKHMDGAGAQLQRIYGIYALSRLLNLPYVHSPLKNVGYQGLSALENNSASADFQSKYNEIFTITSDIELPSHVIMHDIKDADLNFIRRIQKASRRDNKLHLVRILYPYSVTDKNPEIYRCVKAISPFSYIRSSVFRVAIHVRRGEQVALNSKRMLPNSYYISSALQLTSSLKKLGISFVCELYTEVPSKTFIVTPEHHGIKNRITGDITITPQMNALDDFEIIPNLIKAINLDPIETLRSMATADALIMSRSSFSYMAALLNTSKGIAIYHPFWHSPLKEWLVSNKYGHVRERKLIESLEAWKWRQS